MSATAFAHTAGATSLSAPDRLDAVTMTGLLDSDPEGAFDQITRVAQRCLHVPVALIVVVDDKRQFFKSQTGLEEPWRTLRQTPLSHSFCQHVVTSNKLFVVNDARSHPIVRDNGAVTELGVIAYLGVPLRTPDDHVVGALCVADSVPRSWSEGDVDTLDTLADAVMAEIAVRYDRQREAAWTLAA